MELQVVCIAELVLTLTLAVQGRDLLGFTSEMKLSRV